MKSFQSQLKVGEETIDPATWAGSVPHVNGIAPRIRIGHSRWFNLLWLIPIGFVLLLVGVATAKGLRNIGSVQTFIADHPGSRTRCPRTRCGRRSRTRSACLRCG